MTEPWGFLPLSCKRNCCPLLRTHQEAEAPFRERHGEAGGGGSVGRGWGTAAELRGTCVCPLPSLPREEEDTTSPKRRAQFEKRCAFCPGADMEMATQGKLLRGATVSQLGWTLGLRLLFSASGEVLVSQPPTPRSLASFSFLMGGGRWGGCPRDKSWFRSQ